MVSLMDGVRVWGWWLAWRLAGLVLLVAMVPARLVQALVRAVGRWVDAAEIGWLLAVARRRVSAQAALRAADAAGRCPLSGVCLHRPGCRDRQCPGRPR